MAIDLTKYNKDPKSYSESESQSTSKTTQQSVTSKVLDPNLVSQIMGGLLPAMTDDEISAFAENLLKPILNAGLESAQQQYDTTELALNQQLENLAASLATAVQEQRGAYKQGAADVETAALSRGMGRSSYTMQTLAGLGDALAKSVRQLTDQNARQSAQIQQQITQAAQQSAQTQGRLKTDYASNLAAKIQELRQNQRSEYNQNYMTAVSGALGSKTDYTSQTDAKDSSLSISGELKKPDDGSGGSGGGSKKKSSASTGGTYVTVNAGI